MVGDVYPNTLHVGLKCLCMVSDVDAIADMELAPTLQFAINAILMRNNDSKQLEVIRSAVGFISNASVKNGKVKVYFRFTKPINIWKKRCSELDNYDESGSGASFINCPAVFTFGT